MPLYEYYCQECGQEFEKIVRFSEVDKLPECPVCSSRATQKKVSLFATQGAAIGSHSSSQSCSSAGRFT